MDRRGVGDQAGGGGDDRKPSVGPPSGNEGKAGSGEDQSTHLARSHPTDVEDQSNSNTVNGRAEPDPAERPSPNHSAQELASLLDARLPGVLRLVRAEQARRKVNEKDGQEFLNGLERLHAEVLRNLRAGNVVAAHELIGDFRDSVTDFLNDPLNHVVTRFRYIDTPERGQDAEYDSLVAERRRNYETVQDLYPGTGLSEEIR